MKVLIMDMKDDEGTGMDLALRAQEHDHEVHYWTSKPHPAGEGLVDKIKDWNSSMAWAELVVLTGNCDYPPGFDKEFASDRPIFGTNPKAAEMELDRGKGQEVLDRYGIETLPYEVVSSPEDAIKFLVAEGKPYAMKPWGGASDKSMTAIPKTVDEAIFTIQKWKKEGCFKGQLMLQECVEGVEMGISGFFGPGGWSSAIEESFEHKKLMNEDLGGNTGEMGTVIRHVSKSLLFDRVLEPLSDYLHLCGFVGDCSVNCIIDDKGVPWPLEFTVRLGWPDFCIRQEVVKGDPVEWMRDLIYGRDTLRVSEAVAVGVVMAHGDFPLSHVDPPELWSGYPITGITDENWEHFHAQQVADGSFPVLRNGSVSTIRGLVTAGPYVGLAAGSGGTVRSAARKAYKTAWEISWASNVMFRTDIGERLREDLPKIQKFGYAKDMVY